MKKLIIDPQYGISGDMLSAALLDLGARRAFMLNAMTDAASAIGSASITVHELKRIETKGILLEIVLSGVEPNVDASELYTHIEEALIRLGIKDNYYDFALRALDILIHAEFEAHSEHHGSSHMSHEDEMHGVHLHEAKDIIIDLIGAAAGLQDLNIDIDNAICLSPIMTGGGKINFSHGETDVPAPATSSIIKAYDLPVKSGPVDKELFTPTGAAILASLNPQFEERSKFEITEVHRLHSGTGFGTLDLSTKQGIPNALFVFTSDESE